ncbi:unnamed protein product [Gadus morhua 'NCC']
MMVGVDGGMSSDPTASTSNPFVTIEGTNIVLEKPPTINLQSEETLSACDYRATMEREMALDEPSTSTSTSTFSRPSRGTDKIGTDTIRALYKRNLELDNDIRVLDSLPPPLDTEPCTSAAAA